MLRNKTAIESWNILKYEVESIIDQFVPLKKQGKRSRKKHLSKEAIKNTLQTNYRKFPCIIRIFSLQVLLKSPGAYYTW